MPFLIKNKNSRMGWYSTIFLYRQSLLQDFQITHFLQRLQRLLYP
jgi:hypothetical protein